MIGTHAAKESAKIFFAAPSARRPNEYRKALTLNVPKKKFRRAFGAAAHESTPGGPVNLCRGARQSARGGEHACAAGDEDSVDVYPQPSDSASGPLCTTAPNKYLAVLLQDLIVFDK